LRFYDATGLDPELSKHIHSKFYETFKEGDRKTSEILLCGPEVLKFHPKLNFKFLVCNMTNVDHIKVPRRIKVITLKGSNIKHITSAGEHCIHLLLSLLKKKTRFGDPGHNLYGKKALVIGGLGRVGLQVCRILKAFKVRVNTYDRIRDVDMRPMALVQSDIIIMAASVLTPKPILEKHHVDAMKDGAYIINIARPCLVDEDAIIKNIDRLGGYATDFPVPSDFPPNKNVIWTEHTGGYTWEDLKKTSDICFYKLMEEII